MEVSPEEIAETCLEIQAEWSPDEKLRRWCYPVPTYAPRTFCFGDDLPEPLAVEVGELELAAL